MVADTTAPSPEITSERDGDGIEAGALRAGGSDRAVVDGPGAAAGEGGGEEAAEAVPTVYVHGGRVGVEM